MLQYKILKEFFTAPFMAMKSLILVDFLGIERLTNSFGLLLMFQGFAVMMGPPLIGEWSDFKYAESTKKYLIKKKSPFSQVGFMTSHSHIIMFM